MIKIVEDMVQIDEDSERGGEDEGSRGVGRGKGAYADREEAGEERVEEGLGEDVEEEVEGEAVEPGVPNRGVASGLTGRRYLGRHNISWWSKFGLRNEAVSRCFHREGKIQREGKQEMR